MQSDRIRRRLREALLGAAHLLVTVDQEGETNDVVGASLETIGRILRGLDSDSWGIDGLHTFAAKAGLKAIAPDLARLYLAVRREELEKDKALGIDKYTPAEHTRALDKLAADIEAAIPGTVVERKPPLVKLGPGGDFVREVKP